MEKLIKETNVLRNKMRRPIWRENWEVIMTKKTVKKKKEEVVEESEEDLIEENPDLGDMYDEGQEEALDDGEDDVSDEE